MKENDFDIFKLQTNWPVDPNDSVEIFHVISKTCRPKFTDTFPILYRLMLECHSILSIDITNPENTISNYTLYTWIDRNDLKCGWLCKNDVELSSDTIPERQILLDDLGEIQKAYNQFGASADFANEVNAVEKTAQQWLDHIKIIYN